MPCPCDAAKEQKGRLKPVFQVSDDLLSLSSDG